jgi:elongation factor 1-gamma
MAPFATLHTTTAFVHARTTKIIAVANLSGLALTIPPNFVYGQTNKTPEYLSKFPHGKLPALETSEGFYLTESSAIAFYLAESGDKKEQLIGRTKEDRALVQMWVSLADTDFFPNSSPVMACVMGTEPHRPEVVNPKEEQFNRGLKRLELHLNQDGQQFLVRKDEPSLADLCVAASLFWSLKLFMGPDYREGYPKILEWWERLMAIKEVGKGFGAPFQLCEKAPPRDGSFQLQSSLAKKD